MLPGYTKRFPNNEKTNIYRGVDKSLARLGRKQARKNVRDARDFNIETRAVMKCLFFFCKARRRRKFLPFWQKNLFLSFLVGLRTYQHPRKIVFFRILEFENSVMEELNNFLRAGRSIYRRARNVLAWWWQCWRFTAVQERNFQIRGNTSAYSYFFNQPRNYPLPYPNYQPFLNGL